MSWNLPFAGSGFPPSLQASLPSSVSVDQIDLYWSAVTVGRPNLISVLAHGSYSIAELMWRSAIVDANITKLPSMAGLHNSPAFDALDMTEKGWINFSLGMLFTKLCADKLLGMPWLFHFKWFQSLNPVGTLPGGSTPDFIGLDPSGPHYHSLEAKGRNAGYSSSAMAWAKAQALQAVSVNGQRCGMHIGALLYRIGGNRLAMAMEDPEPEGPPRMIEDTQRTWSEYYRVAWGLVTLSDDQKRSLKDLLGVTIELDLGARPFIEELMVPDNEAWRRARDGLIQWSAGASPAERVAPDDAGRRTFRDGIRIVYQRPSPATPARAADPK